MAFTAMLLVGAPAFALVGFDNVSFDGSLEVRGISAKNEADLNDKPNDQRGVTGTRTRIGATADVTEDVKGRLELDKTPANTATALYGRGPNTVNSESNAWVINNAYVDFANLWGLGVRLGRQYVGEAGDLVWHIGAKDDDAMTITSIDGLAVRWAKIADKLDLDAFTGKWKESANSVAQTNATSSGDVNLSNLQATLRNVLPTGNIWVGLLLGNNQGASPTTADNVNLNIARVGVNGGVAENVVTYRAEFLQDYGHANTATTRVKFKGNALDLGVGLNAPETGAGKFGVWANYLHTSGDKNATDKDDKSFNDFTTLGVNSSDCFYGEIFGRSNALAVAGSPLGQGAGNWGGQGQGLQVVNVGADFKPTFWTKGWFKADWFNLGTSENVVAIVNPLTGETKTSKKLGNEVDLTVGYDHSDNVGFKGGFAFLTPDDGLSLLKTGGTTNNDTITEWFGRATVKWGGAEK